MMSTFKIKSDLPRSTQIEIDRIQAINEAQRTQTERDFLTALSPYLTNEVWTRDGKGLITHAFGLELPNSDTGFRKNALFTLELEGEDSIYKNIGDANSAQWQSIENPNGSAAPVSVDAGVDVEGGL